MTASAPLPLHDLRASRDGRDQRDRLEVLTALISAPSFDAVFREDIIRVPAHHAVFPWHCEVIDCERPRWQKQDLCAAHSAEWQDARAEGTRRSTFIHTATPLKLVESREPVVCRICKHRPAFNVELALCHRHRNRWRDFNRKHGADADFDQWLTQQTPCPSYGECRTRACDELACSPLGLCVAHERRYYDRGKPGGASLPRGWFFSYEYYGHPVPVSYTDKAEFLRWCQIQAPVMRIGEINLRGLTPLLRAELKWGLHEHGRERTAPWELPWIQGLVDHCHALALNSLVDLDLAKCGTYHRRIAQEIIDRLRRVYYSPSQTREAGFLEIEHFGVCYRTRSGHVDLTAITQRWLRDLTWDHLANRLRSPQCPRTAQFLDSARRACMELSAFLEVEAPQGGHQPHLLEAEHMHRFVAEIRHRERRRLPCLSITRLDGQPSIVTEAVRNLIFNYSRKVLREALENGEVERLGLNRGFITVIPPGGTTTPRKRTPFPDEVARALADEANLRRFAEEHDPNDRGLRDIWEAIILTGRRASEVIKLRLECVGRYNGLPLLWHDQTKVGNYDEAIRIPERLYDVLTQRQRTTLARFADQHRGRLPSSDQRHGLALFPSHQRNRDGTNPISYNWFNGRFKKWVEQLDLGHYVAHQARHTMATRLLRHGASLSHIRRYLGHVSDRMAEHYVKVATSEIEDVLQHVWVAGPGASNPGELLTSNVTPMNRLEAEALALDLSRRTTPTEGGFCTFQPVVDGGACLWKLDCENCDKFVLSGADLLYWRRKREQWASIAERAPDDATADYLHEVFAPTARAIEGLEKALAGIGLLDDALALDLRRPQDYFQRLWNTGFRARDLAHAATTETVAEEESA